MNSQKRRSARNRSAQTIAPQSLLSAGYFETPHSNWILQPEKKLMLAILEDAIDCFQSNVFAQTLKRKWLFYQAEKWIVQVGDGWVFSFENICKTLRLDPASVRKALLRRLLALLTTDRRKKRETEAHSEGERQQSGRRPSLATARCGEF